MSTTQILWAILIGSVLLLACFTPRLLGIVYIPHSRVGVIEKYWSYRGSLAEGRIIALHGEAGFQGRLLRGGLHTGLFPWEYRIHRTVLVTVAEGRIGYVYARGGAPLDATQTLGRTVECNFFQDAAAFLNNGGQRGRQRAILREGVYAINTALFVVLTETQVYSMEDNHTYQKWQAELASMQGYRPVVIAANRDKDGEAVDTIGIVSVHD